MKYKRFIVQPAARPNAEINVTPLVDVVLVLLIIFMVVTPLLEKDIDVRVPATEQVEAVTEVPPDQLVVTVTKDGELKVNEEAVAWDGYVAKLRGALSSRKDKLVFFVADDKSNYGKVVSALDGAKQAGALVIGMTTDVPEKAVP